MEFIRLTLGLIAVPAIYFVVGLPWAAVTRLGWAPLWGVGILGLGAEAAFIAGAPVAPVLLVLGALHLAGAAVLVLRRRVAAIPLRDAAIDFAWAYALALVPVIVCPFALPGGWGGDWLLAWEAGRHIMAGERFVPELLARPPLFGAAAIPALGFGVPVASFQIFCAVASACVLQFFPSPARRGALPWVLAGSVFFLQVTANAWPKFLCAAFLLAARRTPGEIARYAAWVAGAWLGLAVATHQSAVLFVPLLAYGWLREIPSGAGKLRFLAVAGVTAAAIVLPWEIHTVSAYGWEAKWLANPAVSQRVEAMPAWLNAVLVAITTFVAWGPVRIVEHWLASPDRFSLLRLAHEIYWLATGTFNSLAGSLLGLVLPWWVAWGGRDFWRCAVAAWARLDGGVKMALGFTLLGQMALNPFYSPEGSLQTGWVPVGVALALWFTREAEAAAPARQRRLWQWTWWLGLGPWLAFNLFLTAALTLAPGFRRSFVDSDLLALDRHGWTSLALQGFPWLQLMLVAFWLVVGRRRHVLALSGRAASPAWSSLGAA